MPCSLKERKEARRPACAWLIPGKERAGMTEYQIEANTRRCALSGRELRPGEKFYSVLFDEGGKFQRRDYSTEVWQGPPPNAFSFWTGHIPLAEENPRPR